MVQNQNRIHVLIIVLLAAAVIGLTVYFSTQINFRELNILSKESVIDLYESEMDNRQQTILSQNDQIFSQDAAISDLELEVTELQYEIESRTCQSVSIEEFDRRVRLGTTYVITPAKMEWSGYWALREDVLFEREGVLARGYEFYADLTPANYGDDWQEVHTTIRGYESSKAAKSYFDNWGTAENTVLVESSLDIGLPIKIIDGRQGDPEKTVLLSFYCGNFQVDIKTKRVEEIESAVEILEKAAVMIFHDLSVWVP